MLRKIVEGGMGSIYLAEQVFDNNVRKLVALKVVEVSCSSDEDALRKEATIAASLRHESIVQLFGCGRHGDDMFIVLEFVHGADLFDFQRRHEHRNLRIPLEISVFIISRILRALHYAHTRRDEHDRPLGIVHSDVSPGNIMIDTYGFVKLTDFGVARWAKDAEEKEQKLPGGKFAYMSPEQAGGGAIDARTDIYCSGLVLYELLTGVPVFTASSRQQVLQQAREYRIKPPSQLDKRVPPRLDEIVMTALEFSARDRFDSAMKFCVKLERYLYSGGYGPTTEKLGHYFRKLFEDIAPHPVRQVR
ncbi:MAG: serine/threonine-protein kinase [Planctomycetota bacterium]|nr:serine/threonine-protein kinase [Planctomycetota bacterium]